MPKCFSFLFNEIEMLPALVKPAEYDGKECLFSELVMHYARANQNPAIMKFLTSTLNCSASTLDPKEAYTEYQTDFENPQFAQTLVKIIQSARCHAIHSVLDKLNTMEDVKKGLTAVEGLTAVQNSLNELFLIIAILKRKNSSCFQTILSEVMPNLVSDTYCVLYNISGGEYFKDFEKKDQDLLAEHFELSVLYADFINPYYKECKAKHMKPNIAEKMSVLQNYRYIAMLKYYTVTGQYDKAYKALFAFSPLSLKNELPSTVYGNFLREKEELEAQLHQLHPLTPVITENKDDSTKKLEDELCLLEAEQAQLNAEILERKTRAQQTKEAEKQEKIKLKTTIAALKQSNERLKQRCADAQAVIDAELAKYLSQIDTLTKSIESLKEAQQSLKDQLPKKQTKHRTDESVVKQITALRIQKTADLAIQKRLEQAIPSLDAQIAMTQKNTAQQEEARKAHILTQAINPENLEKLKKELEALRAENARLHTVNLSLLESIKHLKSESDMLRYRSHLEHAKINRHIEGYMAIMRDGQNAQAACASLNYYTPLPPPGPPILYGATPVPMQSPPPPVNQTASIPRRQDNAR